MSPEYEEERDEVERTLNLLIGVICAISLTIYGGYALRDGAWKLGTAMVTLGLTSAVASWKYWRGAW